MIQINIFFTIKILKNQNQIWNIKNELLMEVFNHHKWEKNIASLCHRSQVNKNGKYKFFKWYTLKNDTCSKCLQNNNLSNVVAFHLEMNHLRTWRFCTQYNIKKMCNKRSEERRCKMSNGGWVWVQQWTLKVKDHRNENTKNLNSYLN